MSTRNPMLLMVLVAFLLPAVVGVLMVVGHPQVMDNGERDEQLARVTARLVAQDLQGTAGDFKLGAKLIDFATLSTRETAGVLQMLYRQDQDVDLVVLLNDQDQAVVDPVFLRQEQIMPGTDTEDRLPVDQGDLDQFLINLPKEVAREEGQAFGGVYVNQRKNVALVAGAVAVAGAKSQRPWVLGFERSLRRVRQTASAAAANPGQTVFVVDGGGRLVVHPEGHRFLARESEIQHPVVARFLQGALPGSVRWEDAEGSLLTGAFHGVDFLDWAVVVQRSLLMPGAEGVRVPAWAWVAWALVTIIVAAAMLFFERSVRKIFSKMQALKGDAEHKAEEIKRIQASVLESGKLSAIGDLGAGVAHEINNPLGGILGLTQLLLRKKKENDPDLQFLQRIEQEAKRCKSVIDNLLRFSERQGVEYREPLRLERVVEMTVDLLARKLESQRISVRREFAPDLPRVFCNEGQLQRAFLNVLLNAETAMPGGGVITLSTERDGDWAVLRVADTGVGIPAENRERVFEPFFTTKENWAGAGLGLSVVYQIVKDHGGEVFLESEEGKGTVVAFRFPSEGKAGPPQPSSPVPLT